MLLVNFIAIFNYLIMAKAMAFNTLEESCNRSIPSLLAYLLGRQDFCYSVIAHRSYVINV